MVQRKDELRKRLLALIEDVHGKVMYTKEGLPKGDDEFFMRAVTLANFIRKQAERIIAHATELSIEIKKFEEEKKIGSN